MSLTNTKGATGEQFLFAEDDSGGQVPLVALASGFTARKGADVSKPFLFATDSNGGQVPLVMLHPDSAGGGGAPVKLFRVTVTCGTLDYGAAVYPGQLTYGEGGFYKLLGFAAGGAGSVEISDVLDGITDVQVSQAGQLAVHLVTQTSDGTPLPESNDFVAGWDYTSALSITETGVTLVEPDLTFPMETTHTAGGKVGDNDPTVSVMVGTITMDVYGTIGVAEPADGSLLVYDAASRTYKDGEAPMDGGFYVRQNGAWVTLPTS